MEKEIREVNEKRTYHGKAIRYVRELLNLSQEGLGSLVEMSQKQISRLENKESIDTNILIQIAQALHVPLQILENYDPEERLKNLIQNNENKDSSTSTNINAEEQTQQFRYDNDPHFLEMFERMMKDKDDKVEELMMSLAEREKKIIELEIKIKSLPTK